MKYSFIVIILFFCLSGYSQEDNEEYEIKPLINDSIDITGFGCPLLIFSNYQAHAVFYFGGAGGLIIDNHYFIGGFGSGMTSSNEIPSGVYKEEKFELGYWGVWCGYIYQGKKLFHPEISVMIGWGSLSVSDRSARYNPDTYDSFFMISPSLELCYTPWKFLRLGIGASYNKFNNLSFSGITDDDFTGPGVYAAIKVGWY